ncbi:MAG TPA: transposase [Streptosporangiaceae bacterium]
MSDAEWAVIEPLLPAPGWMAGRGGWPGIYCRRDIVDAIRYLTHNGPVWRALPADLPHWRTVYGYVRDWQASPRWLASGRRAQWLTGLLLFDNIVFR